MSLGIPPLLKSAEVTANKIILLASDVATISQFTQPPQWGIFHSDNGSIALQPESIIRLEYKHEWNIPNYPQEKGAFESYNKVQLPFEVKIGMTKGGTEAERSDFLNALEDIAGSLDLYDVVTPEISYLNANIQHFDYARSSDKGVTLLTVEVWLIEIRNNVASIAKTSATPSGATNVNIGPKTPVMQSLETILGK